MLVVFPMGLLCTAAVFDVLHLITDVAGFPLAAAYTITAGSIGGLVAALFGFIDWRAIPADTRAKRIGSLHGIGNFVVLVLFAISGLLRTGADSWEPGVLALILSFAGAALLGVAGWFGGELVDRLGVGVDEGAHLNAPSSMSRRHAPGASRIPPG